MDKNVLTTGWAFPSALQAAPVSDAHRPASGWIGRCKAAWVTVAALMGGLPAQAQDAEPTRPAAFAAPSQAWAHLMPGSTQREERVRSALQRAVPAPRVAALVQEILPPGVQVAVVHNPPGGLGAYYPGLSVAGYEHVYANERERRMVNGTWGLIVLDAQLEEQATRETIAFVLAHEYAHHRLEPGHSEAHADTFARYLLAPLGLWSPRAAESAFELAVGRSFARRFVPTIRERMRALEEDRPAVVVIEGRLR